MYYILFWLFPTVSDNTCKNDIYHRHHHVPSPHNTHSENPRPATTTIIPPMSHFDKPQHKHRLPQGRVTSKAFHYSYLFTKSWNAIADFSRANETTLVLLNTEIDIGYADVLGGGKRHKKKNHHHKKRKRGKDRRNDFGLGDGDDEQRYHQSKINKISLV